MTTGSASAAETFVGAEFQVMDAYGLAYQNHYLDLPEPRIRARVIEAGQGEPILLVHGALAVAAQWAPLMAELTGRRVLAVDLPGYGLTDPYVYERGRLREVGVAFLGSVIGELGLDGVPVVATSMGGLWSSWLALDEPSRVTSLALIGCPALILDTSAPLFLRLLAVRRLNRMLVRMLPSPDGRAQLRQMGDGDAATSARTELLSLFETKKTTDGYWPASFSLLEASLRLRGARMHLTESELARIRRPTVFVWGANDPFGSPRTGDRAAAAMPDAYVAPIPGGHLPWIGRPDAVANAIHEHLA